MSKKQVVSFRFQDNGTEHDDIVLELAGHTWVSDSYWLRLETVVMKGRRDAQKVLHVMETLRRHWYRTLANSAEGQPSYLAHAFDDEYTQWLKCTRRGKDLQILHGYGHSALTVSALHTDEYVRQFPNFFAADGVEFSLPLADFLASLEQDSVDGSEE